MSVAKKYEGIYRGTVLNNVDPMFLGRLMVTVTDVSGVIPTSWAMPCFPMAGLQTGVIAVPPIDAGVFVMFEQGDPDYPVWMGCFMGEADVPVLTRIAPPPIPSIALQTVLQNGILISDVPGPTGGIMLKSTTGASLIVNDTGIYIQNGKGASIIMVGPTVTVNAGALVIT